MKIIESLKIKEKAYVETLENGLKIIIVPKKNTNKKYIIWGVHFGSIDNHFIMPGTGEEVYIPDGVAHFLEHKMFEKEDGHVLEKFPLIGGSSNAFTSYTHTVYQVSGTEKFYDNLNLLINFVEHPYFTDKNVEKEKMECYILGTKEEAEI